TSLLAWQPAAIITTGFDHTETSRKFLKTNRIRVAELMDIDNTPIDIAVGLSHHQAGIATAKHLVTRGYRNIAYVGHDWKSDRRALLRYNGLCAGLQTVSQSVVATELFDGASSTMAGR